MHGVSIPFTLMFASAAALKLFFVFDADVQACVMKAVVVRVGFGLEKVKQDSVCS